MGSFIGADETDEESDQFEKESEKKIAAVQRMAAEKSCQRKRAGQGEPDGGGTRSVCTLDCRDADAGFGF